MSLTCEKCGETAYSKCPDERTVFAEDQQASILRQLLKINVTPLAEVKDQYKVVLTACIVAADSPEEAERDVISWIRSASDETIKHYLCDHIWRGVCGFGHTH